MSMRWTVGLLVFFFTVIAMNFTLVYIATAGADPVDPRYLHGRP